MQSNAATQNEELFIETFVDKGQKKRIKTLLKSKKGRKKFRDTLAHSIRFNPKFIKEIPKNKQTIENIIKLLSEKNTSGECSLISEHTSFDGKEMALEEAINNVVGSGIATIILCIPSKLAYYEGEGFNNRFILKSN
jgi:hypothetical protein